MANKITQLFKKKPLFRDNNNVQDDEKKLIEDLEVRVSIVERRLDYLIHQENEK